MAWGLGHGRLQAIQRHGKVIGYKRTWKDTDYTKDMEKIRKNGHGRLV